MPYRIPGYYFNQDKPHHEENQPTRDMAAYYVNSTGKYFHITSLQPVSAERQGLASPCRTFSNVS
jgi:hypothetical protein